MIDRLTNMLNCVSVACVEGDIVEVSADEIFVGVVHDNSSAWPASAVYVSSLSEDDALQSAYDMLETHQEERQTDEERQERQATQDTEGYDSLTEAYDGKAFAVSPDELMSLLNHDMTNEYNKAKLDGIEFSVEIDFNEFFDSYIETALWATSDMDEDGNMLESLDEDFDIQDFDPKSLQEVKDRCQDFIYSNLALIEQAIDNDEATIRQIAHDFWLTQNGHGAGFWDGGYPETGDELTTASKSYGSVDLYQCDGVLYV